MTKEEYLKSHNTAYEWADGTIDLCLPIKDTRPLTTIVNRLVCPLCQSDSFVIPNTLTADMYGVHITCAQCEQPWFIHKYVHEGGTLGGKSTMF